MTRNRETIDRIPGRHGRPFAGEIGPDVAGDEPMALFRLLCCCPPGSARISREIAMDAARALARAGWTTPGLTQEPGRLARQVKGKPKFGRLVDGRVRASCDV